MEEPAKEHSNGATVEEPRYITGDNHDIYGDMKFSPSSVDDSSSYLEKLSKTPYQNNFAETSTLEEGLAQEAPAKQQDSANTKVTFMDAEVLIARARQKQKKKLQEKRQAKALSEASKSGRNKSFKPDGETRSRKEKKPVKPEQLDPALEPSDDITVVTYGSPRTFIEQMFQGLAEGNDRIVASVESTNEVDIKLANERRAKATPRKGILKTPKNIRASPLNRAAHTSAYMPNGDKTLPLGLANGNAGYTRSGSDSSCLRSENNGQFNSTDWGVSTALHNEELPSFAPLNPILSPSPRYSVQSWLYFPLLSTQMPSNVSSDTTNLASENSADEHVLPTSCDVLLPVAVNETTPGETSSWTETHADEHTTHVKTEETDQTDPSQTLELGKGHEHTIHVKAEETDYTDHSHHLTVEIVQEHVFSTALYGHYRPFLLRPTMKDKQKLLAKEVWLRVSNKFEGPPYAVTLDWLNRAATAMFEACNENERRRVSICAATVYSHADLQLLASSGVIVCWWWLREGLYTWIAEGDGIRPGL